MGKKQQRVCFLNPKYLQQSVVHLVLQRILKRTVSSFLVFLHTCLLCLSFDCFISHRVRFFCLCPFLPSVFRNRGEWRWRPPSALCLVELVALRWQQRQPRYTDVPRGCQLSLPPRSSELLFCPPGVFGCQRTAKCLWKLILLKMKLDYGLFFVGVRGGGFVCWFCCFSTARLVSSSYPRYS